MADAPACSINAARVRQTTDAACITITELADTLVRNEGRTFRAAHEVASHTARAVIAAGQPLSSGFAAFAQAFRDETGRACDMTEATFAEATAPETFIARRDRPGGPAKPALVDALQKYRRDTDVLQTQYRSRMSRVSAADAARDAAFQKLRET